MSTRLMRIGELAERTGLSQPTIRHYDETGLLSPSARTAGNFRLYSEADYEKLMVVRRMKPLGFSVEEMRQLLLIVEGLRSADAGPGGAGRDHLLERLRAFIADAIARRDRLQRNLDRADEFISVLRAEEELGLRGPSGGAAPPDGHGSGAAAGAP
jgi:DNA-binding transcriptional MerR regulator